MNIVINREEAEPIVIENVKGTITLARLEDGVTKLVIGELSVFELALMIKSITTGDDQQNEILRLAWAVAEKLPKSGKEDVLELHHEDGLNDPFAELMGKK